eukprot:1730613-Ditylum_brightwellii.AAC.1
MKKPQQGKLLCNNGEWLFAPGRKASNKTLPLPNVEENAISLAQQRKLFEGWKATRTVFTARHLCATSNLISTIVKNNHISASDLALLNTPIISKHILLNKNDKKIWE